MDHACKVKVGPVLVIVAATLLLTGCGGAGPSTNLPPSPTPSPTPTAPPVSAVVVNSLEDMEQPPAGTVTLRAAVMAAAPGETITFAPSLDGGVIHLTQIGESHSALPGEVYVGMTYQGYSDRDYGKSALYAHKNVVIDASSLPSGIIVEWTGGDANPARVLAVYGDLTLKNVAIRGGYAKAEPIPDNATQPYTLARGGGLAVWGMARLENCVVAGNRIVGDDGASRDRGAYGGGIYAAGLQVDGCVISGNTATGYGAAGGGIYSVERTPSSVHFIRASTISGNRVTAQHAYGGGLFSLGGGPEGALWMRLENCTFARNLVEDNPALINTGQFYFRGGGIYLGGGSLSVASSTIVENQVNGEVATFNGSPNIGGGGVAATIGNAHVIEYVEVQHSIAVGNTVNGEAADWYTGSLLHFYSYGYNRIGQIDFSRILAPAPGYEHVSRKHFPKAGDVDGVALSDVMDLAGAVTHAWIMSAASDAGQPAVLWYPPATGAKDQVPAGNYDVQAFLAGYSGYGVSTDDFLTHVIEKLRTDYPDLLGADFGAGLGDLTGVTWYESPQTWPSDPKNVPWITAWRGIDVELDGRLGQAGLNDAFWQTFPTGQVGNVFFFNNTETLAVQPLNNDQRGHSRPYGAKGDIGAIELDAN